MTETEKIISNDLWEHNISGMVQVRARFPASEPSILVVEEG